MEPINYIADIELAKQFYHFRVHKEMIRELSNLSD